MLLQAALVAMIASTGLVVIEMRRIDDRYNRNQENVHKRLNITADQLEDIRSRHDDQREINRALDDNINNLNCTLQNHVKELELYKNKGKEEE